jgi:serine/threonine protein kinase
MLVSNGTEPEFRLGDFGVGLKLEKPDSHFEEMNGDPMIIAPEMFGDDELDLTNIVDVWSLGVLMYWLFTKKKLFYYDREGAERHVRIV